MFEIFPELCQGNAWSLELELVNYLRSTDGSTAYLLTEVRRFPLTHSQQPVAETFPLWNHALAALYLVIGYDTHLG